MIRHILLLALLGWSWPTISAAENDLVVADFENETYGQWQVEGEAFGPGPAKGTLGGQMHVDGYLGERLVNSFFNGDGTTGTLTSPPLEIKRDFLRFLIGGGGHPTTCINLLLDAEIVRTAVGPNTQSGGSERLAPTFWDVRDLRGKVVTIQIVDRAVGGWGHINIDHIVQTNEKPTLPEYGRHEKAFTVKQKYLVIPIKNGADKTQLQLDIAGQPVRRYETELATDPQDVDWFAYFTIESYQGQSAKVTAVRGTEEGFALIRQADEVPGAKTWYTERLRPQFHFSQSVGWNNDPNGMVYLDGTWHLFFQHNPVGWNWGNMTWGHAVSTDLVHWEQLPDALFPGTMAQGACFSGGGTVDIKNTAGWKTGTKDVLVVFLTDTGAGESVAYSNDGGQTFTWYEGNPVVKHRGRDPKVIWYEYDEDDEPLNETAKQLGGHWVMAVYDEHDQYGKNIAFYASIDLRNWDEQSHLTGYYECPEIFELPVDGDRADPSWVILAADARYAIGDFDGRTFTPQHEGKHRVHWGKYYASQTFDNAPDDRRIQVGWVQIAAPGMPFNQTFSFPHELTLRTTKDGVRLFAQPVPEIKQLHGKKHTVGAQELAAGVPVRLSVSGELFDIRAKFEIGNAKRLTLNIGGNRVTYDVAEARLGEASLSPVDGSLSIQILVDRNMIETCGNDGRVFITSEREKGGDVNEIELSADGGNARLIGLDVYELETIWPRPN